MKKWILVFLVLIGMRGMGQVPTWEWARQGVSDSLGASEAYYLASDYLGNVYQTGVFTNSLFFDTISLMGINQNIYIVKYNSSGNLIWANSADEYANVISYGIASDAQGNVYLTGSYYSDTIKFGSVTLVKSGTTDIFVVKYNSAGNVVWAISIGDTADQWAHGITTDNEGNFYITGGFSSPSLSFGTHTINNIGTNNIFLAKYDSSGNVVWAKSSGGINDDETYNIACDAFGNVVITGYFTSQVAYFGLDSIINNTGVPHFFLTKYDSSGNALWVRSAEGANWHLGFGVTTDLQGSIFATGYFKSPIVNFGLDTLYNSGISGDANVFIVKYDLTGNILWAKSSIGIGAGYSIVTDANDNVYVSGGSMSSDTIITFDSISLHIPLVYDPMFLIKFNSSGQTLYGKILPSGGDDYNGVALGLPGYIYIGGDFYYMNPYIFGNDSLFDTDNETPFIAKLCFSCSDAGIPQISPQPTISLFPNPFSTSATLLINGEIKENSYLYIYNLLGEEVKTIPIINQKEIIINRDNLADGMYFYKIIGNKNETIAVGKMVVE